MTRPVLTLTGDPIRVEFRPGLRALRGKLRYGGSQGSEVYAASFLRERLIVLDSSLLRNRAERDRILAHEVAHFVWWKAGPTRRSSYEAIISRELRSQVPGEMGWSAEWRKNALRPADLSTHTLRYREYLSESFCDTSAALICSIPSHEEVTLPATAQRLRFAWMRALLLQAPMRI